MDVLLERITCPSWQASVAPTGPGVDLIHGSALELGSPLEQWDCAVNPQG